MMPNQTVKLPLIRPFNRAFVVSLVVTIGAAAVSLAGLLFQSAVYPTEVLRQSFVANDVVNLVIGLPILFGSMWLARSGRLVGLLCWPGALLYVTYNYIAYVVARPVDWLTKAYLVLTISSGYIIYDLLDSIDWEPVGARLDGVVPRRMAGWILVAFGTLFLLRAAGLIVGAIVNDAPLPAGDLGVSVADIAISPLYAAGGLLLLRRKALGYVAGLGLLFATSMLFIGLIIFLVLQPLLTDATFVLIDIMVIAIMGLICFVPFGLYMRGVVSTA